MASISSWYLGLVRPPVTAYGRTRELPLPSAARPRLERRSTDAIARPVPRPADAWRPVIPARDRHRHLLSQLAILPPLRRLRTAHLRSQRAPHSLDKQSHLIRDKSHITIGSRKYSQTRPVADRHHDQEPALHLDDRLRHRAALEHPRRALRQARQA